ncbi:hypothetical protein Dimus_002939 [Dionaea muscipula]
MELKVQKLKAFMVLAHTLLVLVSKPEGTPTFSEKPGLICSSQFVLASAACLSVPPAQLPPPSPPAPSPQSSRAHRHRRHRRHHETENQQECCHWIRQIDNNCVCDLLVHLPVFLSRQVHNYTVYVDEACSVSFQCPGRLTA